MIKTQDIKLNQPESDEDKLLQIEYDELTEEEALNLMNIITTNKDTFSDLFSSLTKISFISSNEETTLKISSKADLKKYLLSVIPTFNDKLNKMLSEANEVTSEAMFLRIMLMNLYKSLGLEVKLPGTDEEFAQQVASVYSVVAAKYYQETATDEDYADYLLNPSAEEQEKILFWLNNRNRYNLLNMLLHDQYQILVKFDDEDKVYDTLIQNRLDDIISVLEKDFLKTPTKETDDTYSFPTLSKEALNELCIEFFQEIDPTGKWLEYYKRYHQEQIVYCEKSEEATIDWCNFLDQDDDYLIVAPLTGTITDFRDLVHEIGHIVSLEQLQDGDSIPPSLLEFPAIFMEFQAIKFLRKKGYSQEVLDNLYIERTTWTAANCIETIPLLRLLSRYLKNSPLTMETEQEYALSMIGDPARYTDEERDLLQTAYPFEEIRILEKTDEYNDLLIMHPDLIYRSYPYTIGKYLAVKAMDKDREDPQTTTRVLDIIANLKNENPEDVITKLGLDVEELSQDQKPKEYKKTEN